MKLKLKQLGPKKMEVISENWTFIIGGEDSGPNSSQLLAAALASCEAITGVVWASRRLQIELSDLEAEVEYEYAERSDRIARIDVTIRNVADKLGNDIKGFKAIAKGCLISKTLKNPPELTLEVE